MYSQDSLGQRPPLRMADTAEGLRQSLEKSIMGHNGWTLPGKGPSGACVHSPGVHKEGSYLEVTADDCIVHYEPHMGQSHSRGPSPHTTTQPWSKRTSCDKDQGYIRVVANRPLNGTSPVNRSLPLDNLKSSPCERVTLPSHQTTYDISSLEQYGSHSDTSVSTNDALLCHCDGSNPSRSSSSNSSHSHSFDKSRSTRIGSGCSSHSDTPLTNLDSCSSTHSTSHSMGHASDSVEPFKDDKHRSTHSTSLPNMIDLIGNQLKIVDEKSRSTLSLPTDGVKAASRPPRRSLPKLNLSQEDVQQKQQSISEQFTKKLRHFMKSKKEDPPPLVKPRSPETNELDETMSVTSLEVADILAGAAPPGLSDDEVDDENDETATVDSDTETLDGSMEESEMSETVASPCEPLKLESQPVPTSKPSALKPNRLSHFVEQSMESFLTNVHSHNNNNNNEDCGYTWRLSQGSSSEKGEPRQNRFPVTNHNVLEQRPVSVFNLIQNYALSDVVVSKASRELASGLALRDKMVTFQNFSSVSSPKEKFCSCILPCVAGTSSSEGVATFGSMLKGDLIIEVSWLLVKTLQARATGSLSWGVRPEELHSGSEACFPGEHSFYTMKMSNFFICLSEKKRMQLKFIILKMFSLIYSCI